MAVKKKKVLVAMSGGVDSTVTALLLQKKGFDIIGVNMKLWVDFEDQQQMPLREYMATQNQLRIKKIVDRAGIPFFIYDFGKEFREKVVDYFVEGYGRGATPNPCVQCNRSIKFGVLFEKMKEIGADYVATGHYARIVKNNGIYELHTASDKTKDQTYFLYTLSQQQLSHILFPLGDYTKKEVREMARGYNADELNEQNESQNLCFLPGGDYAAFLKKNLRPTSFLPGPIMTVQGVRLGTHRGLPNYTVGQRKGIFIGGVSGQNDRTPWFVVRLDLEKNALIVGHREDLLGRQFSVQNLNWIAGSAPDTVAAIPPEMVAEDSGAGGNFRAEVKVRYRTPGRPATVQIVGADEVLVTFDEPCRAITPGQAAVFYQGEKVLGGGLIQ